MLKRASLMALQGLKVVCLQREGVAAVLRCCLNPVLHIRVHPAQACVGMWLLVSPILKGTGAKGKAARTARDGAGSWGQRGTQPCMGTHDPARDVLGRSGVWEHPMSLGASRQLEAHIPLFKAASVPATGRGLCNPPCF